ncbi:MAG: hypothetical protein L0207_06075 [Chlamydiae bacterium]|nr:hypothetical protein [Chlamydiota bacterium]
MQVNFRNANEIDDSFVMPLGSPLTLQPIHGKSSLTSVDPIEKKLSPSKPQLDSPLPQFVNEAVKLDRLNETFLKYGMEKTEQTRKEIEENHQKDLEIMKNLLKAEETKNKWKTVEDLCSILSSIISIGIGKNLGARSAIGGAMIFSGVLGTINTTLSMTNGWDTIFSWIAGDDSSLKETLKKIVPSTIGWTTSTLSILGSTGAFFFSTISPSQQIIEIGKVAVQFIQSFLTTRSFFIESEMHNITQKIELNKAKIFQSETALGQLLERIKEIYADQMDLIKWMSEILSAQKQVTTLILERG